jgi:hypothetical protein
LPNDNDTREPNSGLCPDVLAKVSTIFGAHLADVLIVNRRLETITNETNIVGRQNLLEAFSHLAILFARAPEFDHEKQLEQVAFLSDHLRRTLMEGFELEVYVALNAVWNGESPDSIGRLYEARAASLIRRGKLLGHVTPDDVNRRLDEIIDRVDVARSAKVADGEWEIWKTAASDFDAAADAIRTLKREMGAAVDGANALISSKRQLIAGIVLSAVAGVALGYLLPCLLKLVS